MVEKWLCEINGGQILNAVILSIIALFSILSFRINLKKQKQDLWELRYKFYKKAFNIWGHGGFFHSLMYVYRLKEKEQLKSFTPEDQEQLSKLERSVRLNYPNYLNNGTLYTSNFESEIQEAKWLFDEDIASYLQSLNPEAGGLLYDMGRFKNLRNVWENKNPFHLEFQKYLNL